MNAVPIHPPLYTKVMGRPRKNRKKAPEEKLKKGVKIFTKAGVTMHCSTCGKGDHNRKGHDKYVRMQQEQIQMHNLGEDEEIDIPSILEHVIPHTPEPSLDPTHLVDSMVYRMQQEARENVPIDRVLGPLPESAFVVAARQSIPQPRARVTTASSRGTLRGRGRGRTSTPREPARSSVAAQQGRRNGKKRSAEASTSGTTHALDNPGPGRGRTTRRGSYNTGPGSTHHLLFGDDQQRRAAPATDIPDLNAECIPDLDAQEVPLTQSAPQADDM